MLSIETSDHGPRRRAIIAALVEGGKRSGGIFTSEVAIYANGEITPEDATDRYFSGYTKIRSAALHRARPPRMIRPCSFANLYCCSCSASSRPLSLLLSCMRGPSSHAMLARHRSIFGLREAPIASPSAPFLLCRTRQRRRPDLRILWHKRPPPPRLRGRRKPQRSSQRSSCLREETYRRQAPRGDAKSLKTNTAYRASVQSIMGATAILRSNFLFPLGFSNTPFSVSKLDRPTLATVSNNGLTRCRVTRRIRTYITTSRCVAKISHCNRA